MVRNLPSQFLIFIILWACSNLSAYSQPPTPPPSCLDLFNGDTQNAISYVPILLNSGITIDDIGNYQACTISNTSKYFLGSIYNTTDGMLYLGNIGLCLPSNCTVEFVNSSIPALIITLGELNLIDPIFEDLEMVVSDPLVIDYENNFYTYFTIVVLVILSIFVVIGTFQPYAGINWQNKKLENTSIIDDTVNNFKSVISSTKIDPTPSEKFFDCFNAIKNFNKLFSTKILEGHDLDIGIFNGIRTLSFFYVVYGHEYFFRARAAVTLQEMLTIINEKWMVFVMAGLYAVDVFFFLSGFFVAFVMTDKLKKMRPSIINYLTLVFHRYIRIMPLYIMVLLIYWKLSVLAGSGPLWASNVDLVNSTCDGTWWQHLLLIDNWGVAAFNSPYCFDWGWYLACDFQLFLVTPFFLWLYVKNQKMGKLAIIAFLTVLIAVTFVVTFVDQVVSFPAQDIGTGNGYNWYYIMPYTRGSPYVFGLLFALLYKEWKSSENNEWYISLILRSRIFRIFVSFLGIGIIMFVIWIVSPLLTNPDAWSNNSKYAWSAICRPLFVAGVTLFILPSLFGKNRFFTGMLNNSFFLVMAKISFCGYLVHLMIINMATSNSKGEYIATNLDLAYDWCSSVMLSTLLSIILILLIETPCVNLELTYLRKRHVKKVVDTDEPLFASTSRKEFK